MCHKVVYWAQPPQFTPLTRNNLGNRSFLHLWFRVQITYTQEDLLYHYKDFNANFHTRAILDRYLSFYKIIQFVKGKN